MRPSEIIMPLETTVKAVGAILQADPSVTPQTRSKYLAVLRSGLPKPEVQSERIEKIIRRREVASRMSRSLRFVDKLAASGVLRKVKLPHHQRAIGFREEDVNALLA